MAQERAATGAGGRAEQQAPATLLIVNPTGFARSDLAFCPGTLPAGKVPATRDGTPLAVQPTDGGVWIDAGEIAALHGGRAQPVAERGRHVAGRRPAGGDADAAGERLSAGRTQRRRRHHAHLRQGEPRARCWPPVRSPTSSRPSRTGPSTGTPGTWTSSIDDKMWLAEPAESVARGGGGPLRATLEIRRRILHSDVHAAHLAQPQQPAPGLRHDIDWHERHILLKVAFPVDVLQPDGDLRDPVGQRRAADAPQHELGLGALRDLRPEVGGPERRRLRREPAQRLQVRPRHPATTSCASACCAARPCPTQGRPGRAPLRLQPAAARRPLE